MGSSIRTKIFEISTSSHTDFVNVTPLVKTFVMDSGIKSGLCVIYVPHTTAAVFINEGADPDVVKDIAYKLNSLIQWEDPNYKHIEGNSAAHIKSAIIGNSRVIPVSDGKLLLGTWEAIFFAEFDGPRRRKLIVTLIGE
ncbi:MAG TPA: YjbQ family protein [Aquifex aeolicus]|uniref:YjbQ family protein n=1 Tax=Aquifex aeolicus TaxID=63363 RepID=A0A9D0YRE4_AQUAO|nr:YjbQ family protein [Aquificales bacterium]HIP86194.1 YjbQ family protein [Aquifex sp.]HIP98825.1 YjbQ family protein [Aquifex aeolicus]HIQ26513.1 YjbQ family protein [Aquifex aeolicus]